MAPKRWGMLALLWLGCGAPTKGPTSAVDAQVCWPIVPLTLEVIEHGNAWEPTVFLEAGGRVRRKSSTVGLLEDDHFKMLVGGTLTCTRELRVELNGSKTAMHYDDEGALVEGSQRVQVAKDGTVSFGKMGPGAAIRVRVVGLTNEGSRRTAALLAFAALM